MFRATILAASDNIIFVKGVFLKPRKTGRHPLEVITDWPAPPAKIVYAPGTVAPLPELTPRHLQVYAVGYPIPIQQIPHLNPVFPGPVLSEASISAPNPQAQVVQGGQVFMNEYSPITEQGPQDLYNFSPTLPWDEMATPIFVRVQEGDSGNAQDLDLGYLAGQEATLVGFPVPSPVTYLPGPTSMYREGGAAVTPEQGQGQARPNNGPNAATGELDAPAGSVWPPSAQNGPNATTGDLKRPVGGQPTLPPRPPGPGPSSYAVPLPQTSIACVPRAVGLSDALAWSALVPSYASLSVARSSQARNQNKEESTAANTSEAQSIPDNSEEGAWAKQQAAPKTRRSASTPKAKK